MSMTKIEFAVQMTCDSCVDSVKKSLRDEPAIKNVDVNLETGSVVVETTLPTLEVQKKLESTGKKVVVRGFAGRSAAVAILDTGENKDIQGVVRFIQVAPKSCIIDGTVDGLKPKVDYGLSVHECGDISQGCKSVGDVYSPPDKSSPDRLYGSLGNVWSGYDGRADFRFEDSVLNVSDIIGRSLVLSEGDKNRIICGIIARSSGLFENPKTICACDGVTIWDEKKKPAQATL